MARPGAPRVVVVGAGAAGLAAAARLSGRGLAVTVLEARHRPGGRIDTRTDAALGIPLEHGAEFVHGRPGETLALARGAGAAVREVPERHHRRRGSRLVDGDEAFSKAQELLALGTRDEEPFAAVRRRAGARRRHGDAAAMAEEFVRGFYLADPRTASSLALARMTRALEETGGAVSRVEGGYARILDPLLRAALRSAARGLGLGAAALEDRLDGAAVADWTRDPFAGGGYAVFPTGSEGASEALARSVAGTLFFAGEATAGARAGTVDGALATGERAAREVLGSL
jgi:glycine/D-amino acid oxidase-like deaminating enzyme